MCDGTMDPLLDLGGKVAVISGGVPFFGCKYANRGRHLNGDHHYDPKEWRVHRSAPVVDQTCMFPWFSGVDNGFPMLLAEADRGSVRAIYTTGPQKATGCRRAPYLPHAGCCMTICDWDLGCSFGWLQRSAAGASSHRITADRFGEAVAGNPRYESRHELDRRLEVTATSYRCQVWLWRCLPWCTDLIVVNSCGES